MALQNVPTYRITPSSEKVPTHTNYISLFDFTHQYMPQVHKEIANIYGNQSSTGFLHLIGAESSFASDKYIWTEEGRLHTVYKDVTRVDKEFKKENHVFRKNETVVISDNTKKVIGLIIETTKDTFKILTYKNNALDGLATSNLNVFVYGSEFRKGTDGMSESLETQLSIYDNKPIIMKEVYKVNGSDATQISWVEVRTPTSTRWLWYLLSEYDTRRRYEDKLELALMISQKADTGSDAERFGYTGTEGGFEAIRNRGNIYQGVLDTIEDIDELVKRFDAQGKIQDYTYYVDRESSLAIDNLLGQLNAGFEGGVSYGIFKNDKDMCVNLGFQGFRRGTYNFFKTDWKLLNDPTLLGSVAATAGKIRGMMIPVGAKEVYEEYTSAGSGNKITAPFLQVKYRSSTTENRRHKSWTYGSVGGSNNSTVDDLQVHHLSERMLVLSGANNFVLFEGE